MQCFAGERIMRPVWHYHSSGCKILRPMRQANCAKRQYVVRHDFVSMSRFACTCCDKHDGEPYGFANNNNHWRINLIRDLIVASDRFISAVRRAVGLHQKPVTAVTAAMLFGAGGFAVASLAPDASDLQVQQILEVVQPLPLQVQTEELENHAFSLYRSDFTRSSDSANMLLRRLGINDPSAAAFVRSDEIARRNLLGWSGRYVSAETTSQNALLRLQAGWNADDAGNFNRLVVQKTAAGFQSTIENAALVASTRLASGTIQSSLFAATDDARIPDPVAVQVAEIFSGDIDFRRDLRKGDRFSIVYEMLEGDGQPMRSGRVLSAEFVNMGTTYQAIWFQDSAKTSPAANTPNKGAYYTLDGQSLQRSFLASPLEFSRVTSGFRMRFHPILKSWRKHQGVDYGAPSGTPVRNVGDGIVEFAGVQKGFGNVVFVRHRDDRTSVYAHLSRIDVKRGQALSQGELIGKVGSTGWATGPNLHFESRLNGQAQDPLAMAKENDSIPMAVASRPLFDRLAASARMQLTAAATIGQVE